MSLKQIAPDWNRSRSGRPPTEGLANDNRRIIFSYNREVSTHAHIQSAQGRRVDHARRAAGAARGANLAPGAKVSLTVDNGRLVIEPKPRPRYTLAELLAQCDPSAEPVRQDREWLDAKPVGTEIL